MDVAGTQRHRPPLGPFLLLRKRRRSRHDSHMTTPFPVPNVVPAEPAALNANEVFSILGNEKRRRLLVALADGVGRAASQLAPLISRTQDATMKHLLEMKAARLVTMARDPVDERRQLYTLSPAVQVRRTEAGLEMDFGCCLIRLG